MSEAKLISGKEYSLSDLLSSDFILSIPDLQRDYCWGVRNLNSDQTEQDEIVSSFIDSIIEESAKVHQGHSSTGLIYAYEWPKGTYQLCDGQQRITTLFLTVGILNRLLGKENNDLKKILIRKDSTRTGFSALQYGIRETSLHFLDDLVIHYFLGEDELNWRSRKEERESKGALLPMGRPQWYYREYDDDITIQAVLCALYIINDKLKTFNIESLENIKDYILNTMTFIFYDMVSRRKGEETFVIINNTGEPLSSTENLKPRLLGMVEDDTDRKTYVKQWEAREDFFWFNRLKKEFTSDSFSKDFYDWYFLLTYGKKCDRELLKDLNNLNIHSELESIELTFKSFLKFFDYCIGENAKFVKSPVDNEKIFKIIKDWENNNIDILDWLRQNERNIIVIPILAYIRKFRKDGPIEEIDTLFFRKILRNYLSGKHEIENIKLESIVKGINQTASIEDLFLILPGKYIKGDDEFNYGALKEMELDPLLRMNTDVLFSDDCTALDVITRYKNLSYLSNLGKEEFARHHIEDSNAYRVLRVLKNWGGNICHQYNKTWDLEGRLVNNLNAPKKDWEYALKYKSIYNSEAFLSLINQKPENLSKAIFQSLKEYILKHSDILNITIENYSPESFFKAWAYAKFLVVWQSSNLLSLYDGTPFGGFRINPKGNMINPDGPFILANCVARTFYKGGYNHVNKENYRITNFDSPLFDDTEMPYESWDTQNEERKQILPDFFFSINERIMKKHEDFLKSDFKKSQL